MFPSPAREMCSACLTPVYPVEKMMVNKVALHYNCFCCRHCKKKLSIHNYSSLYGEFYCISHYQQLFKRKGNYDEGFGRTQHKDRWLLKDKGADEPDTRSTPKTTQKYQNPAADVVVTKASTRPPGGQSGADGKLKISWPPEKKTAGVNPAQIRNESVLKNKISDINKAASVSVSESQSWDVLNHRGQIRDKVIKEPSKASLISEKPSPAGHFHIAISSTEAKATSPLPENGTSVKNQEPTPARLAPTLKSINSPVSNRLETSSSKQKKSVRFAPNVDEAQCDLSNQLSNGAESEMLSDQSEQNQSNKPRTVTQLIDGTNEEPFSKEENKREGAVENASYRETTNEMDQELDAEVLRSREISKIDEPLTEVEVEVNDLQILTRTSSSSADMRQPEPSGRLDSEDSINKIPSEDPSGPHTPAGHGTKDEGCLETKENQLATPDTTNDHDASGNPKKPVARTNSKTIGSWSKGKSPLSKLFTSRGNDKTTRAEAKDAKKPDVKPSGGLLGRLFQSSPDTPKPPAQHESDTTTHNDDKSVATEVVTKEMQENVSDVGPLEADVAQTVKLEFSETDAQGSNCRSTEETNHNQSLISESGEDPTGQGSESQSNVVVGASDPQTQSEDPLSSVINTVSEEPISSSIPEGSTDTILNNDIFGECSSSFLSGEVLVNTDELSPKTNKLAKEPEEEGGALFDLSNEQSSDLFGLSSLLTETPEPAAENISLMDSHPLPAETQEALIVTDLPNGYDSSPNKQEDPTDPFGVNDQTGEKKADFDLFSSTDQLFPPAVNVSDQGGASTTLISSFPDDIFGVNDILSSSDVFAVLSSSSATSNSLNDLLGSDIASTAAPPAQIDLFTEDLFAAEAQLLPTSGPRDADMFEDNLLVSEDKSTEKKPESNSWMDDLLG